jgi:hypothetical protein
MNKNAIFNRLNNSTTNNNNTQQPPEPTAPQQVEHVVREEPKVEMPQPMNMPSTNFYNEAQTNDDEWNDDDSPPIIQPIKVEQYQEEYSAINDTNDFYENIEEKNGQNVNINNVVVKAPLNSGHGKRARALYDFTASEPDEISFDPGDVIENIQMVGFS